MLYEARLRLNTALLPEKVDLYEPERAMPRDEYRRAVVEEEVASLIGPAAKYAAAFDAAGMLIESAAGDIFGQLVLYPLSSFTPHEIAVVPGSPTVVTFTVAPPVLPELGTVAWLSDPLFEDAVQVNGFTFQVADTGEVRVTLTADLLRHSGRAWRAAAPSP
jgi:hypothetical protein